MVVNQQVETLRWVNAALELLDQRLLPHQVKYLVLQDATAVAEAIQNMVVRGAPAIGVTAAYGAALSVAEHYATDRDDWREAVERSSCHAQVGTEDDLLDRSRTCAIAAT